ncbi:MAG TPA: type II toxin-antitoxin system prevent-host-death family antitoxin [Thermoanaerobaculia bacterium]|nr:type II toxin-antitoxin system prevent-host-death family antitoxin [Thermoanaerobaculia bacterium]
MTEVGVKVLKDRLSQYLRRAREGERIVVTERGKPIALLSPIVEGPDTRLAWKLVRKGVASWAGGKPKGSEKPPRVRGKSAAEMIVEDRR